MSAGAPALRRTGYHPEIVIFNVLSTWSDRVWGECTALELQLHDAAALHPQPNVFRIMRIAKKAYDVAWPVTMLPLAPLSLAAGIGAWALLASLIGVSTLATIIGFVAFLTTTTITFINLVGAYTVALGLGCRWYLRRAMREAGVTLGSTSSPIAVPLLVREEPSTAEPRVE